MLAAFSAAVVTVLSKAGIKKVDPSLAFAVQSVLIVAVAWTVVGVQGHLAEVAKIDGKTWGFLIAAGIITCFSSLFTFRALKTGEASQVNPLERLSLVFAIIMAAIFLKEKITWQVVVGGILMAAGALVIATTRKA